MVLVGFNVTIWIQRVQVLLRRHALCVQSRKLQHNNNVMDNNKNSSDNEATPSSNRAADEEFTKDDSVVETKALEKAKISGDHGQLPEKFEQPNESKIIAHSRTELLAQLNNGKAIRVPYRLWRIAIQKCTIPHSAYLDLTWQERDVYSRHVTAVQRRQLTYDDPGTKNKVMTVTALLLQEKCCGNACRHCPYGHVNVPAELRHKKVFNGAYYV